MAIRVEVYTIGGMASGVLASAGTLREALSAPGGLQLEHAAMAGSSIIRKSSGCGDMCLGWD